MAKKAMPDSLLTLLVAFLRKNKTGGVLEIEKGKVAPGNFVVTTTAGKFPCRVSETRKYIHFETPLGIVDCKVPRGALLAMIQQQS